MSANIRVMPKEDLQTGPSTAGMVRSSAFTTDNVWMGEARTNAGTVSGWHHHGEHATYGYVVRGGVRFEFGSGGKEIVQAGPGDYFAVPPHTVHRESNPDQQESVIVLTRVGAGPTVTNVEGPDS
ncbi:MAG: cupin domain-containing protein [Chloroflexota bacterium]